MSESEPVRNNAYEKLILDRVMEANADWNASIGRAICYLAFNAYVQNGYLVNRIKCDKPIPDQVEDIIFEFATTDETGAYGYVPLHPDRGRAMLLDPSMNPVVQRPTSQLVECFDKVDAYFDARGQD